MSTDFKKLTPREVRALAEANKLDTATGALCPDYVKASLLILPSTYADDFLRFASWNPEIFPVLEVIREKPVSSFLAPGANLCTALPRYRVFLNGEVSEDVNEVKALWNIGSVGFLIGCTASADGLLLENGLSVRHVEEQKAMPLYETKLRTNPTGPFRGPVVVAMRPLSQTAVKEAYRLTESLELVQGAPLHIGAPSEVGIRSLETPDYGDAVRIAPDETPVFWSSPATMQAVLRWSPTYGMPHSRSSSKKKKRAFNQRSALSFRRFSRRFFKPSRKNFRPPAMRCPFSMSKTASVISGEMRPLPNFEKARNGMW